MKKELDVSIEHKCKLAYLLLLTRLWEFQRLGFGCWSPTWAVLS